MRIVDRATFLAMPAGTLFSKYEPCIMGPLHIKAETRHGDFRHQPIADAIAGDAVDLLEAAKSGSSLGLDFDCTLRDGLFGRNQLFAVWEAADVRALISRLRRALADAGMAEAP